MDTDPEWCNEVYRRWERRRMLPFRRFDRAVHDLGGALVEALRVHQVLRWLDRQLRKWPALYRRL
jgi:hypothetical protein